MLRRLSVLSLLLLGFSSHADVINVPLSVWANQAIVSAYSYNYDNIVKRQKITAKFFTSNAWLNFSRAQLDSGILDAVKKNYYKVRAVATQPPKIIDKGMKDNLHNYQVIMPLLVTYTNPQYQQKQNLAVTLNIQASNGGNNFQIRSFVSKTVSKQQCQPQNLQPATAKQPAKSDKNKK